jgi:hypothetical protein
MVELTARTSRFVRPFGFMHVVVRKCMGTCHVWNGFRPLRAQHVAVNLVHINVELNSRHCSSWTQQEKQAVKRFTLYLLYTRNTCVHVPIAVSQKEWGGTRTPSARRSVPGRDHGSCCTLARLENFLRSRAAMNTKSKVPPHSVHACGTKPKYEISRVLACILVGTKRPYETKACLEYVLAW